MEAKNHSYTRVLHFIVGALAEKKKVEEGESLEEKEARAMAAGLSTLRLPGLGRGSVPGEDS